MGASKEFWDAVRSNQVETVASLIEAHPDWVRATCPGDVKSLEPDGESKFSNTALHFAAWSNHQQLAETLLDAGAEVDAIGYESIRGLSTPLILATANASVELLRLLLDKGADPNLPGSAETALYTAAENSYQEKVELLLARGARHDIFTAAIVGDCELVVYHLEACPALLKARSAKRNRTPWDEAATHEQDEVMAAVRAWTEKGKEAPADSSSGGFEDSGFFFGGDEPAESTQPDEAVAEEEAPKEEPRRSETPARVEGGSDAGDWEDWADPNSSWPG